MLIRFAYAVEGPVKFLSHLDLLKLFSKSVKRANIPVAYSEGYNPHPKIAFGPPRGVGIAGLQEYCDIKLAREMAVADFIKQLNQALPKGIQVLSARELQGKVLPLMAAIQVVEYQAVLPNDLAEDLEQRVSWFEQQAEVFYLRKRPKKKDKLVNVRESVLFLQGQKAEEAYRLTMRLAFAETGSAKPSEVLAVLLEDRPCSEVEWLRTGMWVQQPDGALQTP